MKSSSFIYINMYNTLPRQHNKTVACISLQHGCYLGSKQATLSLTSIPLYPLAHAERGNEPRDKGYPIHTMKLLTDGFHGAWVQFWRVRAWVCSQCSKIQARKPYIYHSSAEKKKKNCCLSQSEMSTVQLPLDCVVALQKYGS